MKKNYLIIFVVILLLSAAVVVATAKPVTDKEKDKTRVIAHTDKEVSDAESKGCKVVQKAKTLKALECSKDAAASLGLQEDIQVFAMDSLANTQIGADLVQTSGNTGAGRKVVILDTGYNYNHPELISSYLGGKDFVNNDTDPMDDNGHGSHVAGIITVDGINSLAKGVAPGTGIIAGKVLDASGSGYFSNVVAAIYWAVDGPDGIANTPDDFNADAISLSLGTSPPYTYSGFCDGALPDLTNAINYAINREVIVVVAAGNSGTSGVSIPGCISYSTTVGAVDSKDNIASFSGRGTAADITAPGVNILSSWLGTSYAYLDGTSMATPMVSGTVALIKSAHPNYTVAQTQDVLFKTAKDLGIAGKDSTYGWGRVDAYKAAGIGIVPDTTPPVISNVQVSNVKDTSATITWTTNEPSDSLVRYGTTVPPSSTASAPGLVTSHSIILAGLSSSTKYYFEVQSTDGSGNTAFGNNSGAYYSFTTTAPAKTLHVLSINMSTAKSGTRIYAIATVTIVDAAGNRVQGATLNGHWSGLANNLVSGTTDVNGRVALNSNSVRNKHGTFTFTVDNVVLGGWVYNPVENIKTSNSITV